MNRLIPLVATVLLSACGGDGGENAPMLKLNVKRDSGESAGDFAYFARG